MLLPFLLGSVALQAWAWRSLRKRVLSGAITRFAALVRYGGWALMPLFSFAGLMCGMVGLEELSDAAIIPEPLGRATLPIASFLLASALLGWLCFSILCALIWRAAGAKT